MFTKITDQVLLGPGNTLSHIMNDLLHFSKTNEEQTKILQQVFDRIREAKFTLNLAKSHFAGREVEYLGHIEKLEYPLLAARNKSTCTALLMSKSTWIDKENELQTELQQKGICQFQAVTHVSLFCFLTSVVLCDRTHDAMKLYLYFHEGQDTGQLTHL